MGKSVPFSLFHKKSGPSTVLVSKPLTPWWCYTYIHRTIWEWNSQSETFTLRWFIAKLELMQVHLSVKNCAHFFFYYISLFMTNSWSEFVFACHRPEFTKIHTSSMMDCLRTIYFAENVQRFSWVDAYRTGWNKMLMACIADWSNLML